MKLIFANSFFKSLSKLRRRGTWWYKTYEFFRYDIGRFCRNVRKFRKELWKFYPFDYIYNLALLRRSLQLTLERIENGYEVEESRLKKVSAIKRVIEIILKFENDSFTAEAESELGEIVHVPWDFEITERGYALTTIEKEEHKAHNLHNSKVFKRAHELEEKYWEELWRILKGKSFEEEERIWEMAKVKVGTTKDAAEDSDNIWKEANKEFDGSGMRGWWD
jgi:hypothetical protein